MTVTAASDGSALNAARRAREWAEVAGGDAEVDVLVVGLGVTGAGVALDAAARGLTTVAVDAFDLAWGTSRFSSKLVHGGLRYLAQGQIGIARESAQERGILMTTTAPHLVRPVPMLMPAVAAVPQRQMTVAGAGLRAGDALRRAARTPRSLLPTPRRIGATEASAIAPGLLPEGLRGGMLAWDGRVEDDARLVIAIARTAALHGARILTRTRALALDPAGEATLRDELSGETSTVRANVIINATGVWASELAPSIRMRPARGTHLVLEPGRLPAGQTALTVPIPGEPNRYALILPQNDGRTYVGITDVEHDGPIPDVAEPTEAEIGSLLDVLGVIFAEPPTRDDVDGAYAGLRPLLDSGDEETSELARDHLVVADGRLVTVTGGKLTTYRRMAEEAVDAAVRAGALDDDAKPCPTRSLALVGAAPAEALARISAPDRLVRRYGTEARAVAGNDPDLAERVIDRLPYTLAELRFAISHEGALDAADLVDRRTRIGLVAGDRELALPVAGRALAAAA